MVRTTTGKSEPDIRLLAEQIIRAGQMRRNEHFYLASEILSDHRISDEERRQINRIFDYIQTGRIKLVD